MCQKHTINCKTNNDKSITTVSREFHYWSCSEAPPKDIEGISTKMHKHICIYPKPVAIISKHLNQPIKLSLVKGATRQNN